MHRCLIISLMPLLIAGFSPGSEQRKPDPVIAKYADTSRAARLSDGRHINMVCMGRGKPTVILNAGAADWGVVWGRVQGKIAQQTQVCTWDRAGFGFSTASSAQQSVDETTHDLERALRANKMQGPFVLVGHSIGAYEALIFADRNKSAVAGIVLVDPSIPDQSARLARVAPETTRTNDSSLASFISQRRACADMLDRCPADAQACTQYGGEMPSSVSSALARLDRSPARMRTTASLLDNITNDTRLAVNHGRQYGSTPLIILSASNSFVAPEGASAATRMEVSREQEELAKGHVELAALSRRGERRLVGDAGHYLQLEHPDIVTAAVTEVVTQARQQTMPDAIVDDRPRIDVIRREIAEVIAHRDPRRADVEAIAGAASIPDVPVPLGALFEEIMIDCATPLPSRMTFGPLGSMLITACPFCSWIWFLYL